MAINTDSRGYQSLIKNGYTDEQITQMQNQVLEGQSAKDVIANTPAANPSQIQPKNTSNLVDPIAFRPEYNTGQYDKYIEGRDPTKLNNADINISQYGDDSSAKNYNNSALWGGENQKYTGENTLGSQIAYNPNATLAGLDPNYLYGQAAQMQNSQDANYIARRNDEIASALYNEGKVTIQDVAEFLSKQNQWDYSNENERQNTIMSVWKRIGQIAAQQENNGGPANEPDPSKAEQILSDNSGKIYGKVTAENGEPLEGIDTLEDANSVYKAMEEARVNNLKNMISMNPADIAELMISGTSPYSEQTLRDAQKYYPEFMAQIEAEKKKKLGQQNVNAIASGGEMTTQTNGQSNINNSINSFATSNSTSTKSSVEITKDVNNALAESQTASEASETMASIEEDMAILKNRLKNLRQEATAAFKGDVPQYLVNAYMNNKAQEIQNQMSILEDRYNAAYQRYTAEVQQKQWQMEFDLKKQQLDLQKQSAALNQWATEQGIAIDWYKAMGATGTATTNPGDTYQVTTMSDEEVAAAVDQLWEMYDNGQLGNAQCAAGIQKYYLPMLGINLPNLSSIENKKKLINEGSDYTPKRGDLIILKGSKAEYGHIGIVLGVHNDGTIEYMDWNGSLDANGNGTETVGVHGISGSSSSILGFRNVNKNQGTETQSGNYTTSSYGGYYDPAYSEIYSKYLQGKFAAGKQLETQASSMGLTVSELDAQAKAWWADQTDENNPEVTDRLNAIAYVLGAGLSRLQRMSATADATGRAATTFSAEMGDFATYYKFIKDNLTFDKLIALKRDGATFGALSDNELRAIGNSASSLNTNMSDEKFYSTLVSIYNGLLGNGSNLTKEEIINIYNSGNTGNPAPTNNPMNPSGSSSGGVGSSASWVTGS